MLKRKISKTLTEWKSREGRKPLVIKGVRQCGKTSSVLDFAQKNYEHVIYLNFHEKRSYKAFFNGDLDVDTITTNITLGIIGTQFVPGKTCLIFDEIQDCPRARSSLKFFCLDGRYDVLSTGSLLGVNGYRTKVEQQEEEEMVVLEPGVQKDPDAHEVRCPVEAVEPQRVALDMLGFRHDDGKNMAQSQNLWDLGLRS